MNDPVVTAKYTETLKTCTDKYPTSCIGGFIKRRGGGVFRIVSGPSVGFNEISLSDITGYLALHDDAFAGSIDLITLPADEMWERNAVAYERQFVVH